MDIIRNYYNEIVETEWDRLNRHVFEFEINKRFIKRFIKPNDKVLDLGGGPGKYSLLLAELGCDVTLLDLSENNVQFALEKAKNLSLSIKGFQANAMDISILGNEQFDHILLMGPLYHLLSEDQRDKAVSECMKHLKPGGCLFAAFISYNAGIIYAMKYDQESILNPAFQECCDVFANDKPYSGQAFTDAFFIRFEDIEPFMNKFQLQKLHIIASEGMLAPLSHSLWKSRLK